MEVEVEVEVTVEAVGVVVAMAVATQHKHRWCEIKEEEKCGNESWTKVLKGREEEKRERRRG